MDIDNSGTPAPGEDHRILNSPNTRKINERSLANLQPAWKTGQSGNPRGRPKIGASILEWVNSFDENGTTFAELSGIANDPSEQASKAMAARWLLDARDGRPNVRMRAREEILDRSIGKPIAPRINANIEDAEIFVTHDVSELRELAAQLTSSDNGPATEPVKNISVSEMRDLLSANNSDSQVDTDADELNSNQS